MTDSFVAVDGGEGKLLQTFKNTVGTDVVHAEAVSIVTTAGAPVDTSTNAFPAAIYDSSGHRLNIESWGSADVILKDSNSHTLNVAREGDNFTQASDGLLPIAGVDGTGAGSKFHAVRVINGFVQVQDGFQSGTWGYSSGSLSGAGNVTGSGKCIGIRVFANGTDSTFNINGGSTITVRSGTGVDINPGANVTAPVVNWVSGSIDVVIQGLT